MAPDLGRDGGPVELQIASVRTIAHEAAVVIVRCLQGPAGLLARFDAPPGVDVQLTRIEVYGTPAAWLDTGMTGEVWLAGRGYEHLVPLGGLRGTNPISEH